jgi:hypothetical protein
MSIRGYGRIAAFVLACGVMTGSADAQETGLVLKGGVAQAAFQVGPPGAAANRTNRQAGLSGGLALTLAPYRKLGFQTEVLINERRSVYSGTGASVPFVVMPFLLRARLANIGRTRVNLLIGPEVAASATRSQGIVQEFDDYGMDVGIDLELRHRTMIDVRYTRGLVNIGPAAEPGDSAKTRGLTVMVGWRLH